MHLRFDACGGARADHWIVIDDFGTLHDAVDESRFGGFSDNPARQRRDFQHSQDDDPDVVRAFWCRPQQRRAVESSAFVSHIGLSIEVEVQIVFLLHPAWDDRTSSPLYTQTEGARIEILTAGTHEWDWSPASTSITRIALEAFCWAYLDLEKAREAAKRQAEARHG